LRQLLKYNNEIHPIYKKYKNNSDYISENNIKIFSKEVLEHLPKDYIKEIQGKNNYGFSSQIESKELYIPKINNIIDQQCYYFEDCVLLSESLGKHLLSKIHNMNIIYNFIQVNFMIHYIKPKIVYSSQTINLLWIY